MTSSDDRRPGWPGETASDEGSQVLTPVEVIPPAPAPGASLPEDLRISWSWPHLVVFFLYAFGSLAFVQLALSSYLMVVRRLPAKQIERLLTANAPYVVGEQVVWFGLLMFFLWVTLSLLREAPFWRSVGWRPLRSSTSPSGAAWRYFFSGCALSVFVAVASSRIQQPENVPMQELMKDRTGTLLLMGLAVLFAPLVEETVFRGYLYPLLASKLGVPAGVLVTGVFFGVLHGAQLGWTWSLVALLILVGIVLTYVRARTGTVAASYFVHLGYNSMIAISTGIATHGFRSFPHQP
jgi:membrane protease YdiL (CAAX protease family)